MHQYPSGGHKTKNNQATIFALWYRPITDNALECGSTGRVYETGSHPSWSRWKHASCSFEGNIELKEWCRGFARQGSPATDRFRGARFPSRSRSISCFCAGTRRSYVGTCSLSLRCAIVRADRTLSTTFWNAWALRKPTLRRM